MCACESMDLYAVAACLNFNLCPFAVDSLGQSPVDYAKRISEQMVTLINQAREQWEAQLSYAEI
jgi:phosphoglucomutase